MLRDEWLAGRRSDARPLLRRWMPPMVFVVLRRRQAGERDREDRQADRPNRKPAPLWVQNRAPFRIARFTNAIKSLELAESAALAFRSSAADISDGRLAVDEPLANRVRSGRKQP
jgi:hypothetical protein